MNKRDRVGPQRSLRSDDVLRGESEPRNRNLIKQKENDGEVAFRAGTRRGRGSISLQVVNLERPKKDASNEFGRGRVDRSTYQDLADGLDSASQSVECRGPRKPKAGALPFGQESSDPPSVMS